MTVACSRYCLQNTQPYEEGIGGDYLYAFQKVCSLLLQCVGRSVDFENGESGTVSEISW